MSRKTLRVLVESIEVGYNGDPDDPKAAREARKQKKEGSKKKKMAKNNVILASLVYPRSGAPLVSSKMEINLKSGTPKKFRLNDFWDSGLFKEDLDGETILKIEVLDRDEVKKVNKVLARVFGAIFGGALATITGGISNKIVGALVSLPVDRIKGSYVIEEDEEVDIIGAAELKLEESSIPATVTLPLVAPKTLVRSRWAFKQPGGGAIERVREVVLQEKKPNGSIKLHFSLQ